MKKLIELSSEHGVVEYTWEFVQEYYGDNEYFVTLFINGTEINTDYAMGNGFVSIQKVAHELYQEYKEHKQQ